MKQQTISGMEYSWRKKKTKREKYMESMDRITSLIAVIRFDKNLQISINCSIMFIE